MKYVKAFAEVLDFDISDIVTKSGELSAKYNSMYDGAVNECGVFTTGSFCTEHGNSDLGNTYVKNCRLSSVTGYNACDYGKNHVFANAIDDPTEIISDFEDEVSDFTAEDALGDFE